MNPKEKKVWSSANLIFLSFWVSFFVKFTFSLRDKTNEELLLIGIFMMTIYFVYRYPFFVSIKENYCINPENDKNLYSRKTKLYENLFLGFFGKGRCDLISAFSGYKLIAEIQNRTFSSFVEQIKPKRVHRMLDFFLVIISTILGFFLATCVTTFNWPCGLVFFLFSVLLGYRPFLLKLFYSVNFKKEKDYKINVVLPSSNSYQLANVNYGAAIIFTKTILIDSKVITANQYLKEYVLTHEEGHIFMFRNLIWAIEITSYLLLLFCIMVSFKLYSIGGLFVSCIPAVIYVAYLVLFRFPQKKKEELLADLYAAEKIGREKCIKALQLISDNSKYNSNSKFLNFINFVFWGVVPVNERIANIQK